MTLKKDRRGSEKSTELSGGLSAGDCLVLSDWAAYNFFLIWSFTLMPKQICHYLFANYSILM